MKVTKANEETRKINGQAQEDHHARLLRYRRIKESVAVCHRVDFELTSDKSQTRDRKALSAAIGVWQRDNARLELSHPSPEAAGKKRGKAQLRDAIIFAVEVPSRETRLKMVHIGCRKMPSGNKKKKRKSTLRPVKDRPKTNKLRTVFVSPVRCVLQWEDSTGYGRLPVPDVTCERRKGTKAP